MLLRIKIHFQTRAVARRLILVLRAGLDLEDLVPHKMIISITDLEKEHEEKIDESVRLQEPFLSEFEKRLHFERLGEGSYCQAG